MVEPGPEVVVDPALSGKVRLLLQHLQREARQPVEEHQAHRVAAPHLLERDHEPLVGEPGGVRLDAGGRALGQVVGVLAPHLDVADQELGEVEADRLGSPEPEVDEGEALVALAAQEVVRTGVSVRGEVTGRGELVRQPVEVGHDCLEVEAQVAEVLPHGGVTPGRLVREPWQDRVGKPSRDKAPDVPRLGVDGGERSHARAGREATQQPGGAGAVRRAPLHGIGRHGLEPQHGRLVVALLDPERPRHRQADREAIREVGGVDQWLGTPRHRRCRPLGDLGGHGGEGGGVPPVVNALDEERELPRAVARVGATAHPGPGPGEDGGHVVRHRLGARLHEVDPVGPPQVRDHRRQLGIAHVIDPQRYAPPFAGDGCESGFHDIER
ncbi:hypothetical protein GCM10009726_04930 [Nocardioides furvisabuli]|uniref:Uncharacterized protein n=1 Tax=Nocardioides furvisabuli TaxID=375542 RepID=A0ABN2WPT2_9ACTN